MRRPPKFTKRRHHYLVAAGATMLLALTILEANAVTVAWAGFLHNMIWLWEPDAS